MENSKSTQKVVPVTVADAGVRAAFRMDKVRNAIKNKSTVERLLKERKAPRRQSISRRGENYSQSSSKDSRSINAERRVWKLQPLVSYDLKPIPESNDTCRRRLAERLYRKFSKSSEKAIQQKSKM